MPFPVHQVQPVRMSNTTVPDNIDNKLECVTNTTLCQAIRQLACILRQADEMFQDLGSQCVEIHNRTARIQSRVVKLGDTVRNYNPRKQKIPAGDLVRFSKLKVHYKTDYGLETNLFTKETRTEPIKTLYENARDCTEPTKVQRDVSSLMLMPYFSDSEKRTNVYLDIETCLPSNYEEFTSQLMYDQDCVDNNGILTPVIHGAGEVVTVDVSGKTFSRMTDYRRSLQPSVTTRRKRRKNRDRRNTLACGEKLVTEDLAVAGDEALASDKSAIRRNKNRSRSQEDGRRLEDDVDVSLNVTGGSSSMYTGTGTLPDTSINTSYDDRTLSDINCPPHMPLLQTGEELRRLRMIGEKMLSPTFSDKDRENENYYETLTSVNRRSVNISRRGCNNPDGALSSSGVWTASVSDGSDKETDPIKMPTTTVEVQVRPKSSLSMGVVSDNESMLETVKEDDDTESQTLLENIPFMDDGDADMSVHSCDTEGYYTTFHDFDGFQEVANEYKFVGTDIPVKHLDEVNDKKPSPLEQVEVVYRKKNKTDARPSPPRRHSSLVKDVHEHRESIDTVVHVDDLQQTKHITDNHRNSLLDLSATESDIEVSKHFQPQSSLTSTRFIPSICVVTPTSDMASLNASRATSESPGLQTPVNESPEVSNVSHDINDTEAVTTNDKIVSDSTAIVDNVDSVPGAEVSDCHRLSVTSNSSDTTTNSGKLVSITPDIVKPIKEIGDNSSDTNKGENKTGEIVLDKEEIRQIDESALTGAQKILTSGSGSHLPDMLSHTPEMTVTQTSPETETDPPPVLGGKTSCLKETHPNTEKALSPSPVNNKQPPMCEGMVPKLRITSPFAAYQDTTRHHKEANERVKQNNIPPSPPPSTLSDSQGELLRRQKQKLNHRQLNQFSSGLKSSQLDRLTDDAVVSSPLQYSAPRQQQNICKGKPASRDGDDNANNTSIEDEKSNLKRSDSYRNARTILSPDLSKINRKSPEISPANKIQNATYVSFNNITSDKSPVTMENSPNTSRESSKDDKEKQNTKQNFFKNIRSQFSTLSLRRKPSKKHEADKPQVTPKSEMKRRNSFNSFLRSPLNKTPDQPPRLTSTPINSEKSPKSSPSPRPTNIKSKTRNHPVSEWSSHSSPHQNTNDADKSGVSPPKFRTAALKNQHQRYSYADPHPSYQQHQSGPSPCYNPTTAVYGYVHHHSHHHHPPHYHPPPDPHYGHYQAYALASQVPSQRSSVSSIHGLYQGPSNPNSLYNSLQRGSISRSSSKDTCGRGSTSPPHSVTSDTYSGVSGTRVNMARGGRGSTSPPHSVTSDTYSGASGRSCQCPMCYHSNANPCQDCGCPNNGSSRSNTSSSLSLNNVRQRLPQKPETGSSEFFSPSSDYYSLSPASPTPGPGHQIVNNDQDTGAWSQPIYAKIVKSKQQDDAWADAGNMANDDINKVNVDNDLGATPSNKTQKSLVTRSSSTTDPRKKPTAPNFTGDHDKMDSRRHSWAGDKKGPVSIVPKKTSLHDFKKLLAQQSLGQNPHRISAKELLEKSALGTGGNSQEPIYNYSSSQTKLGGRSKRSSPWVDKRFSVIQEENEGSKENLIE